MTPQQQKAYNAYEYEIRIEKVIDMAVEAALTPSMGRLSESVAEDLICDLAISRKDPSIEELADYLLAEGGDENTIHMAIDDMACARPDLMGVCLQVATPVRRWSESGDSCTFSWGHARLNWVFGATYDDAWKRAVAWAESEATPPKEVA